MSEHSVREVDGCTVIDVAGSYSRQVFLQLLGLAKTVVAKGRPRLVLNMSRLQHITSEGIGLLVLVHDECETAGGKMALASLPSRVEHVLRLAGVQNFFSIYPDEREAVAHLRAAIPDEAKAPEREPEQPPPPRAEAELQEGPDLAEVVKEIVKTVIRSRRHHEMIEFFTKRAVKIASLDEIAPALGIARLAAEHVARDLARSGLLLEDGELFTWQPTGAAEEKLALFRKALADPKLRSRVLAWVYAEEKK